MLILEESHTKIGPWLASGNSVSKKFYTDMESCLIDKSALLCQDNATCGENLLSF